jgi:hypothetical protein
MEPRNGTFEGTLLADGGREVTLETLLDRCLRSLAADVWETCYWPESMSDGWTIGDFNILCVSTGPDREIYLQFWSEPDDDVVFEISSGNRSPFTLKHLGPAQKRDLAGRGFRIGGAARNFGKIVQIKSPREAEEVAREILTILFETFAYRGQWTLTSRRERGQRADIAAVHCSVTPGDFAKVARDAGFDTALDEDDEEGADKRVMYLRRKRRHALAVLEGRVPKQNLYTLVTLEATLKATIDDARLWAVVEELRVLHLRRRMNGEISADMTLVLDGGVTVAWLKASLDLFESAVRHAESLLRRGAPARRRSASAPSGTIH